MIKQNKGRDLHKIPKSKLNTVGPYYCSKKFDGHYTQIVYDGQTVRFYTSGGKRFYLHRMAEYIENTLKEPFHIECEFNYNCKGKLGDRGKSAILTTYRTRYAKYEDNSGDVNKDIFRVLDRLDLPGLSFVARYDTIVSMFYGLDWFNVPIQQIVTLTEGIDLSKEFYADGYEGAMLKSLGHFYKPGKRVNDIIKLKPRKTADLKCIDTKEGAGKYAGMVGSLLLIDEDGITVWAGSGLDDAERNISPWRFIGRVYEIEYERIDETYIQPIIKHRREDKE